MIVDLHQFGPTLDRENGWFWCKGMGGMINWGDRLFYSFGVGESGESGSMRALWFCYSNGYNRRSRILQQKWLTVKPRRYMTSEFLRTWGFMCRKFLCIVEGCQVSFAASCGPKVGFLSWKLSLNIARVQGPLWTYRLVDVWKSQMWTCYGDFIVRMR